MNSCIDCHSRRALRYTVRCSKCATAHSTALRAEIAADVATVNRAIAGGLRIPYEPQSMPGRLGRHVRSLSYSDGAGVWSHDDGRGLDAGSWCEGGVKPEWLAAARRHQACLVTYVCTCPAPAIAGAKSEQPAAGAIARHAARLAWD